MTAWEKQVDNFDQRGRDYYGQIDIPERQSYFNDITGNIRGTKDPAGRGTDKPIPRMKRSGFRKGVNDDY
jgi:hypothetical protein